MATLFTRAGEPLRLNLQLSDGEENLPLVVKAYLKDNEGEPLPDGELTLTHVGLGLFKNYSYVMPDIPEVTAQYVVYEADGITPSPYSIDVDIFTKNADIDALISKLTSETMEVVISDDESMTIDV